MNIYKFNLTWTLETRFLKCKYMCDCEYICVSVFLIFSSIVLSICTDLWSDGFLVKRFKLDCFNFILTNIFHANTIRSHIFVFYYFEVMKCRRSGEKHYSTKHKRITGYFLVLEIPYISYDKWYIYLF